MCSFMLCSSFVLALREKSVPKHCDQLANVITNCYIQIEMKVNLEKKTQPLANVLLFNSCIEYV